MAIPARLGVRGVAGVRGGWPLLAAYAVATFLSFPHPLGGGGGVVDWGLAVSWLAPALLVLGLEGRAPRSAARRAFAAGLVAHSAILHWIWVVTVQYGHAPAILGWLAPIGLALYTATFTAVFGAGWAWLRGRGVSATLAVPLLWTVLEHARSFVAGGFPWATLGYAQHENAALMGLASVTGVYGLSFATAWGGAALAEALRARRVGRPPGAAVWASLAGVALLHVAGLGLRAPQAEPGPMLRVAAIQGNVAQGVKWDSARLAETISLYADLSRRAAASGARVIVWPETAVPAALERDVEIAATLSALARELGAVLVVGAVGTEPLATEPGLRFYDSAFVFGPEVGLVDRYDKSHLVPFGEYLPGRSLLGGFFRALARGIASRDVSAGTAPRALSLPQIGSADGADVPALKVGVPICYELLFPNLVRGFVVDGAALLLAITNDAWYGRTGAPYQFLAMTALRSAENGVWTLRAANTGVTALIDPRGRVRQATRLFERDLLVADVPLRPAAAGPTFYGEWGDLFAWGCWLALTACAGRALRGGTTPGSRQPGWGTTHGSERGSERSGG